MTMYIRVVADTNDGDYIETFKRITPAEVEEIMPVIEAIKNFQPYQGEWTPGRFMTYDNNFSIGDCCREDMGEKPINEVYSQISEELLEFFIEEYVPYGERGIHTIESIELMDITNKRDLLREF